ncbi:MAG TPA: hypothetical protein VLC09_09070 [Polyangiaceae bacterium]|nr:hypothetical protein [Polyangiaceae bacterium]
MTTANLTSDELPSSPEFALSVGRDWFERMLHLGARRERLILRAALALAVLLHVAFGGAAASSPYEIRAFAEAVRATTAARLLAMVEIETEPEPEAPPPEPEPEPEPERPEPAPLPSPSEPVAATEQPAVAPAAAEAGAVLTAPADEPLDLTDQGFVSGSGTRFAGGVTATNGTSTTAVRNPGAVAGGVPGGTGTAPSGPPAVSKARSAGLGTGADWRNCPFPPEAEGEDSAVVRLVVIVGSDGRPKSVTVVDDPGYGFGRAAKRCAMEKMYEPPLDAAGSPISGPTAPFRVRFTRN